MKKTKIPLLLLLTAFTIGVCMPAQASIAVWPGTQGYSGSAMSGGINPGDEGWTPNPSEEIDKSTVNQALSASIDNFNWWFRQSPKPLKISGCSNIKFFDINKFSDAIANTYVTTEGSSSLDAETAACFKAPGVYGFTDWVWNPTMIVRSVNTATAQQCEADQETFLHEFVHAVEYQHNDQKSNEAKNWQERNINYMLRMYNLVCFRDGDGKLGYFERLVLDSNSNFTARKEAWTAFVNNVNGLSTYKYENLAGLDTIPPDVQQLEDWFGFKCNLSDIEAYYRSGAAGDEFKKFFEELDKDNPTAPSNMQTLICNQPIRGDNDVGYGNVKRIISLSNIQTWKPGEDMAEATAFRNQPITITGSVEYDPWTPIDWVMGADDYRDSRFAVMAIEGVWSPYSGTALYEKKSTVQYTGGSDSYSYTLDPSAYPSLYHVYIGNGDDMMYVKLTLVDDPSANTTSTTNTTNTTTTSNNTTNTNTTVNTSPGNIGVNLNGRTLACDVPPTVLNNRTMVPLRAIFEAMKINVSWNGADQSITATQGTMTMGLQIGNTQATRGNQVITLDQAPTAVNNRTMVPLRFVAETLGGQASYDPSTNMVTIIARPRDPDADIFNGSPPAGQAFNQGAYEGSRDASNNPSGSGQWIDKEGNTYSGNFSVSDNKMSINDATIIYPGYTGASNGSGLGGASGPAPGGWMFQGSYSQDLQTGAETFDGVDTYGDGSVFNGQYGYDANRDLYASGSLNVADGTVITVDIAGSPDTPPDNPPVDNTPVDNTPVDTTTDDSSLTPITGSESILFKLESVAGVESNPPNKTIFTLSSAATITKIWTYHWNNGSGDGTGTIGLRNVTTGELLGTWPVVGFNSQFVSEPGAVWPSSSTAEPHYYCTVQPNATVPAGTYEVVDSNPATWSYNSDSNDMGFAWVYGIQ